MLATTGSLPGVQSSVSLSSVPHFSHWDTVGETLTLPVWVRTLGSFVVQLRLSLLLYYLTFPAKSKGLETRCNVPTAGQ